MRSGVEFERVDDVHLQRTDAPCPVEYSGQVQRTIKSSTGKAAEYATFTLELIVVIMSVSMSSPTLEDAVGGRAPEIQVERVARFGVGSCLRIGYWSLSRQLLETPPYHQLRIQPFCVVKPTGSKSRYWIWFEYNNAVIVPR